MASPSPLRDELRRRLTRARVDRDRDVAAALRAAIGALENAEAVASTGLVDGGSEHVAGAVAFGAAGEVARRELSEDDERAVLLSEERDLREAAAQYDAAGRVDEASAARRAADVLASVGHR